MSLHARLNTLIKDANVDNSEQIAVLVTMSKCLQQKAKQCEISAKDLKQSIQDNLMKELAIRYVDSLPEPNKTDYMNDIVLYDLCGYLIKTHPGLIECVACKTTVCCNELDLPADFTADHYTALRTRGGLIFVSVSMFKNFRAIEKVIAAHFSSIGHIYANSSFAECISKISQLQLLKIFCDSHRDSHLPYLIMEYVRVRFYFESKRLKNILLSKNKSAIKSNSKKSKMNI